jgi:hypothetical protein
MNHVSNSLDQAREDGASFFVKNLLFSPCRGSLRTSKRVCIGLTLLLVGSASAWSQLAPHVLLSGLDNPRSLAFAPNGSLYVTESGRAGTPSPDTPSITVRGAPLYYGTTGAITRWDGNTQSRVITDLPNLYNATTGEVSGVQGIGFSSEGDMFFTTALGANPSLRTGVELNQLGKLMRVPAGGSAPQEVADVAQFELANNPAGGPVDSNPYKILVHSSGILVADAGANAVLDVGFNGSIDVVDTLTSLPSGADAVPTSLAMGGGAVFVSQLTGFPFTPGSASVFRLDDAGLTLIGGGFTNVIDLAYGPDNMLYVLELSHRGLLSGDLTGGLWRLDPATGLADLLMTEGLLAPTALTFDADGKLYVANQGLMPGQGQVLTFTPVPEPEVTGAIAALSLLGLVLWRKRAAKTESAILAPPSN